MMAHSHILFGMSCWWGYCITTGHDASTATTALAGIGALLPDIDHPQSALGRRLPLISVPLARVFGHRGITHSLVAAAGVVLALLGFGHSGPAVIGPLCIGYLSHLGGDMLTPSGVPLFWPLRRTFSLNLFRTGSPVETVVVAGIAAAMLNHADLTPGLLEGAQDGLRLMLRTGPDAILTTL